MEPTSLTLSFVLSIFLGPECPATNPVEPGFLEQVEEFALDVLADADADDAEGS